MMPACLSVVPTLTPFSKSTATPLVKILRQFDFGLSSLTMPLRLAAAAGCIRTEATLIRALNNTVRQIVITLKRFEITRKRFDFGQMV